MAKSRLEAALDYWERGWSIIPIKPTGEKKPTIKWRDYQDRPPTQAEVIEWWERWPEADIALVTGAVSGLVVVDCDSPEAWTAAEDLAMHSLIQVTTKRGTHLYFEHPKDGVRRGPRAGSNAKGTDWPKIKGLDFRGDGSYALLPPSTGYEWKVPSGLDTDDAPMWQDWTPSGPASSKEPEDPGEFSFESMDLSDVKAFTAEDFLTEWEKTEKFVRENWPETRRIPTGEGNSRNERVMRFVSETLMDGHWGEDLRLKGQKFMDEFFVDPLAPEAFEATVTSIEEAERRNHPERFAEDGTYIPRMHAEVPAPKPVRGRLIQMRDAGELLEEASKQPYLIRPWLPHPWIVQVYGYTGHGKSLFLQHVLAAACAGSTHFGPFELGDPPRVLYLDYEMGKATIGRRLRDLQNTHGDTGDRFQIWTPFIDNADMHLGTPQGLAALQDLIQEHVPQIVVIDTVRAAWSGLEEAKAEAWAPINRLVAKLRNAGMSVILVHHANKPDEHGFSRESGSSNQLSNIEAQLRVTQVFESEHTAKMKAGVHDDIGIFERLRAKMKPGMRLTMVNEISYGKLRDRTEEHDERQWIGYAEHSETEDREVVASLSSKQRAREMAAGGWDEAGIAQKVDRPIRVVREWIAKKPDE